MARKAQARGLPLDIKLVDRSKRTVAAPRAPSLQVCQRMESTLPLFPSQLSIIALLTRLQDAFLPPSPSTSIILRSHALSAPAYLA